MRPRPSTASAALSRPLLALLLGSFAFNAGSGIGLWLKPCLAWRMAHGWSVPLFLVVVGVVWRAHALRGWRLRKNVLSGAAMLAGLLLLAVSGWLLYYSGSDLVRKIASQAHLVLGLGSALVLVLHAALGWRGRDRDQGAVSASGGRGGDGDPVGGGS